MRNFSNDQILTSILNNTKLNEFEIPNFIEIDSDFNIKKMKFFTQKEMPIKYSNKKLSADKIIFDRNKRYLQKEMFNL